MSTGHAHIHYPPPHTHHCFRSYARALATSLQSQSSTKPTKTTTIPSLCALQLPSRTLRLCRGRLRQKGVRCCVYLYMRVCERVCMCVQSNIDAKRLNHPFFTTLHCTTLHYHTAPRRHHCLQCEAPRDAAVASQALPDRGVSARLCQHTQSEECVCTHHFHGQPNAIRYVK
jgi:hypothetical protein